MKSNHDDDEYAFPGQQAEPQVTQVFEIALQARPPTKSLRQRIQNQKVTFVTYAETERPQQRWNS